MKAKIRTLLTPMRGDDKPARLSHSASTKENSVVRKTFLGVLTGILLLGFASVGSSEMVVSLNSVNVDLPKIEVDIHVAAGKGVAGYRLRIAYDPAKLKYVDARDSDYLPTGGLFLRLALGADDTYALQLTRDDTTTTGQSVVFGEGEDAQTFLLPDFFSYAPIPMEFYGLVMSPLIATPGISNPVYRYVDILRAAPLASDGDGWLATVSFDVLNPNMPIDVHLYGVTLFDANDTKVPVIHVKKVNYWATINILPSDVNADGVVNTLDLTGVASAFGTPVSDANRRADVTADGEINILDLVRVANDLGQAVLSFFSRRSATYVDTSVPVWESGASQTACA